MSKARAISANRFTTENWMDGRTSALGGGRKGTTEQQHWQLATGNW